MYNLTWRTLTDPSQMSGTSVRRQLGHDLISSLKYTFKVDKRNSQLRPTRGYAFSFSTLLAGLNPDNRSARFVRQCHQQPRSTECGYYVMQYILDIVRHYRNIGDHNKWFGSKVAYTDEEINELRDLWAAYFMENHL